MSFRNLTVVFAAIVLCIGAAAVAQPPGEIDFGKAKKLLEKRQSGETLTGEEQAYLKRAIDARQKGNRGGGATLKGASLALKPLTDMTAADRYKGEDGGLYGGGKNGPPAEHMEKALRLAKEIRPLNAEGKPSPDGKIVMFSLGMSNTTQEFSEFVRMVRQDGSVNPKLVVVDGAQGGMEAQAWGKPEMVARANRPDPWSVLAQRLQAARVTPKQVQVVWVKLARANPAAAGEFPKHVDEMNGLVRGILKRLVETYPNVKLAYFSSRIYAGYANTMLNPEPYAYEGAFAVRRMIKEQIEKGEPSAPMLLWGPYLWTNGEKGRKVDDLVWTSDDCGPDGTHPSRSGQRKVAELLMKFFKTDATAKGWFGR